MIKDILNMMMIGSVTMAMPQITLGALNGLNFISKSETASLSETYAIAKEAMADPSKIGQLCPVMEQLASAAGPEAKDIVSLCGAIANGASPDIVMAHATKALERFEIASR